MAVDLDRTFRTRPAISTRTHDKGAVALDVDTGKCWELNVTGAAVFDALARGQTPRAAVEALVARYGVPPEAAAADVSAMVHALLETGLLSDGPA